MSLMAPIMKDEVVDEVELAAHSSYQGTRKQDILMMALYLLRQISEEEYMHANERGVSPVEGEGR